MVRRVGVEKRWHGGGVLKRAQGTGHRAQGTGLRAKGGIRITQDYFIPKRSATPLINASGCTGLPAM